MTVPERRNVVSSFTVVKGAMIGETYATLACWDLSVSKKENLDRLREENLCRANMQTQGSARAATGVFRPLG